MFIGSVPKEARFLIRELLDPLPRECPVLVGCSGNFTIDRLAADMGFPVHANDVSLYSALIADHLMGSARDLTVKEKVFADVFDGWPDHPLKSLISVMFTLKVAPFWKRANEYQDRMFRAYMGESKVYFERTLAKLEKNDPFNFQIRSFFFGDFRDHIQKEGVVCLFAPTYKGGYEKLYQLVDEVFEYEKPNYQLFDPKEAGQLYAAILEEKKAIIYTDKEYPEIADFLSGKVGYPARRDILIYTNLKSNEKTFLFSSGKHEVGNLELIPYDFGFSPETQITLVLCKAGIIGYYKALFMSARVDYSEKSDFGILFLADGKIFGFASFSKFLSRGAPFDFLVLQSDFVVNAKTRKLSKLVISLLQSREVAVLLRCHYKIHFQGLQTSVYTDKPCSMKYRGPFKKVKSLCAPGKLVYRGLFSKLKILEVYRKWMGQQLKNSSKK